MNANPEWYNTLVSCVKSLKKSVAQLREVGAPMRGDAEMLDEGIEDVDDAAFSFSMLLDDCRLALDSYDEIQDLANRAQRALTDSGVSGAGVQAVQAGISLVYLNAESAANELETRIPELAKMLDDISGEMDASVVSARAVSMGWKFKAYDECVRTLEMTVNALLPNDIRAMHAEVFGR